MSLGKRPLAAIVGAIVASIALILVGRTVLGTSREIDALAAQVAREDAAIRNPPPPARADSIELVKKRNWVEERADFPQAGSWARTRDYYLDALHRQGWVLRSQDADKHGGRSLELCKGPLRTEIIFLSEPPRMRVTVGGATEAGVKVGGRDVACW